jgi:glycosyltransferase involved in cell wall biosynthesis
LKLVSVLTTGASGGAEFATFELLDAFHARGHETVVLTNLLELRRETNVEVRPIDLGPKLSTTTARHLLIRTPVLAWRMRRALRAESPLDVLLVHFKKEQLLTLLLPRRLRPVCAWAEWGPVPHPFRTGFNNRLYRMAARRADVILAISEGTRSSVVSCGVPDEKVVVLHNAVRTDEISYSEDGRRRVRGDLGIPADAFVVGCVSRFHPKKRNDVVVEAVRRLDDGAHLILAGAGETESSLRELARPLGDRAHFLATPTSDVADVYSAFDVSVFCPSPTEGAPRAVILAMLTERPAIATGAEGVRDLLEDGGGLILSPENDPETLAQALRRYANDPELRARDGQVGRSRAEGQHAAAAVAARLESLLTEAARAKTA